MPSPFTPPVAATRVESFIPSVATSSTGNPDRDTELKRQEIEQLRALIAQQPDEPEAFTALQRIFSFIRTDRQDKLGEKDTIYGYLNSLHTAHKQLEVGQLALRLMMIERLSQNDFADAIALGETILQVTSGEIRQEGMGELVILYLHTGQIARAQTLFASFQTEYPDDLTVHELLQQMLDDVTNKNFAGQAAKSNLAKEVSLQTSATATPLTFAVEQNYPNPFNPETRIQYQLSEASAVQIKIFNVAGQLVRSFEAGLQPAGVHSVVWDSKDNLGQQVSSGIYIYRLSVEPLSANGTRFEESRKLLLIR